ncbi:peptidylprolyl isomerase [Paenibacillus odorifer]|uniref:peptidylprolyl isomerase n=1 Tax=Paenibacillus TaxID=44249 RepID=UPI0003E2533A|nr:MULTISPECIES: peptidylprolyl isomerase [Paenibacillus]ETT49467.1 PpiC-type peptidyl-prolyl cis-trans isomerase [Paenibacillus sp. FSL H8-237]OME33886.1 peptidylprolyl isomerase [Paenibacillus odorifer]OME39068.1 peptidylprolyl isomerase [Paenibacillus odorifer]OME63193.1 peptidylprolyl isomerase [Paenibacillus odorifer]
MDKKDLNGNENLENNGTTEEDLNTSEIINEEVEVAQAAAEEPVNTTKADSIPVMNKVGANNATPPTPPTAAPRSNKAWMIASIVLAAALIIVLVVQKDDSKKAVATVNGTKITKEQLYDKLIEAGGESTLQSMITTELVDQEAKKANVTVTDEDINTELEDLKAQFGGEAAFNAALSQSSMTVDDLKKQMPLQVKLRKILEPQVTVTDDEIKEYYDTNKATFSEEEQVRASHILVETKEEADAILKQLKEGADFATLAKEKSSDTGSKDNGGDLDFFKRGDMVAEFSDVAFKLKVGETSDAVKSDYGYHIIKVTDHKDAKDYTLEEKKDEIRKTLVSQKVSTLSSTWLSETTEKAKITNTLTDAKEDAAATAEPTASAAAGNESTK